MRLQSTHQKDAPPGEHNIPGGGNDLTATVKLVGGFGRLNSLSSVSGEIAWEPASVEYSEDILMASSSTT